jgi:hypothetical protein
MTNIRRILLYARCIEKNSMQKVSIQKKNNLFFS